MTRAGRRTGQAGAPESARRGRTANAVAYPVSSLAGRPEKL
ncbi:hypothetical protein BSIN_1571 [Burkholderia singularis]|uniref:Uncharacterized protein n=1 Tax=Burkholderia singularis TaxID=1503053 RepID=A0A238GZ81_9BURK|nr:hypothetical protein BSIN_1571 [Burkholderia singularis]